MPERFKRNVARETACDCGGCRLARAADALACAILVSFAAAAAASLEIMPPFGIVICAGVGALAVIWLVR